MQRTDRGARALACVAFACLLASSCADDPPPAAEVHTVVTVLDRLAVPPPVEERVPVSLTDDRIALLHGAERPPKRAEGSAQWFRVIPQEPGDDLGPTVAIDVRDLLVERRAELRGFHLDLRIIPNAADRTVWMELGPGPSISGREERSTAQRLPLQPVERQEVLYSLETGAGEDADTLFVELPVPTGRDLYVGLLDLEAIYQQRAQAVRTGVRLDGQERQAIVVDSGVWLEMPHEVEAGSVLSVGYGTIGAADAGASGSFRILFRPTGGAAIQLFEAEHRAGGAFADAQVDLTELAGQVGVIELGFQADGGSARGAWTVPASSDEPESAPSPAPSGRLSVVKLVEHLDLPPPAEERVRVALGEDRIAQYGPPVEITVDPEVGVLRLGGLGSGEAPRVVGIDLGDVLTGHHQELRAIELVLEIEPVPKGLSVWLDIGQPGQPPPAGDDGRSRSLTARRLLLPNQSAQRVLYRVDGGLSPSQDTLYLEIPTSQDPSLEIGVVELNLVFERAGGAVTDMVGIGFQVRRSIKVGAGVWLEVPYSIAEDSVLSFGHGVVVPSGSDTDLAGRFTVQFRRTDGAVIPLVEVESRPGDAFQDVRVELGEHAGSEGVVELGFDSEDSATTGVWAHPILFDADADARSLLLYLVDTLRADHLVHHGYERQTTPRLDALVQEATVFDSCVAAATWTRPSLASIMTSTSVYTHQTYTPSDTVPDDLVFLSEVLQDSGYLTAGHLTNLHAGVPANLDQGYDIFVGGQGIGLPLLPGRAQPRKRMDLVPPVEEYGDGPVPEAYWLTAKTLGFLDAYAGAPTFLYVHTTDPHGPYAPAEPYRNRFEAPQPGTELPSGELYESLVDVRKSYQAVAGESLWSGQGGEDFSMLEASDDHIVQRVRDRAGVAPAELDTILDQAIDLYDDEIVQNDLFFGLVVDHLERLGLADQTAIVFTSDHGEAFFEHGQIEHGGAPYFHSQVHVPLVISAPWDPAWSSRRVSCTVSGIDITPTVLDLLEIEAPSQFQGKSLAPLLDQDCATWTRDRGPVHSVGDIDGSPFTPGLVTIYDQDREHILVRRSDTEFELWRTHDWKADLAEAEELHGAGALGPGEREQIEEEVQGLLVHKQSLAPEGTGSAEASSLSEEEVQLLQALGYLR